MNRTIQIPDYSVSEEIISAGSHALGAALAVSASILSILKAVRDLSEIGPIGIVSAAIYGATMILLYCMSTIYHALPRGKAKKVFRVIDHCSVFLLIAGTYTPFTLVGMNGALGWTIFGIIWGLTIIGIVFNAIDVDKYSKVSIFINLAMGWLVVFTAGKLYDAIGQTGMLLLVIGGVIYSIGAILYAIGHKVPYAHSIFHFFVLGGSIFHFLAVYISVL